MIILTPERADAFRDAGMEIPGDAGILVLSVVLGGPLDVAGLCGGYRTGRFGNVTIPLAGDIITTLDGNAVTSRQDLTIYLDTQTRVGGDAAVTLMCDGEEVGVEVILRERP